MNLLTLKASIQRALLFSINQSIVCISIDLSDSGIFLMRVQFDTKPSTEDKDLCYAAAAEVVGDFVEISASEVSFITAATCDLEKHLSHLVYARVETSLQ